MDNLENNKEFVKRACQDVLVGANTTKEIFEQYISEDSIQYINGEKLNFDDFLKHSIKLKLDLSPTKVTFRYIVAEHDKVCTIHVIHGSDSSGMPFKKQVNALFHIKEGKIVLCDALTLLI